MEFPDLHLPEIKFTSAPTKTQMVNMLRDISKFVADCASSMVLDHSYAVADTPIGMTFNTSVQLKQAADNFEAGPNASGLAVPQPAPGQLRR